MSLQKIMDHGQRHTSLAALAMSEKAAGADMMDEILERRSDGGGKKEGSAMMLGGGKGLQHGYRGAR